MTRNPNCPRTRQTRFDDSALTQDRKRVTERKEHGDRPIQLFGIKAPRAVSGDFASPFATPGGKVFLAIDRFAIQTLCLTAKLADQLLFAERADELADSTTEIDPQAIFDYLYSHAIITLTPYHLQRHSIGYRQRIMSCSRMVA